MSDAQPSAADAPHVDPLPVDPGHVRTLAHYGAMLAELKAEAEIEKAGFAGRLP